MKKLTIFLTYLFVFIYFASAQEKLVLPSLDVKDATIGSIAVGIDEYIGNKKNGLQWPITKLIFLKEDNKLLLDIIAIDNSWFQLCEWNERPYGYFIFNNRLFMVSIKGEDNINLTTYFIPTDKVRSFYCPGITSYPIVDKPTWQYHYQDSTVTLVKTFNLEMLTK